jgi:hypothetical protein
MQSLSGKFRFVLAIPAGMFFLFAGQSAHAVLIDGIDFDDSWFADAVVDYSPVFNLDGEPDSQYTDPMQALGPPDVNTSTAIQCITAPSPANCRFVSMGDGGSLTLQFTDNFLNGDGTPASDLYVLEVGEAEGSTVEVSSNGIDWALVGTILPDDTLGIGVFTYGFDIDAFGFGINDMVIFVRLTDSNFGDTSNPPGSDFDAVGAIQTVIPVPAAAWLFGSALGLLGWLRRKASA